MTGGEQMRGINTHFLRIHGIKHAIRIVKPKEIIPLVLQAITNLPLWSYEALKDLHIGLQYMLIDLCGGQRENKSGSEKATYTRLTTKARKTIRYTPNDRDVLLRLLYDLILEAEGMGRLHGYGMTNKFGDNIRGNPEHNRMTIPKEA